MYFIWKFSTVSERLRSSLTAFGDLTVADHGIIYPNAICASMKTSAFCFLIVG